jgi:hypothetical protein
VAYQVTGQSLLVHDPVAATAAATATAEEDGRHGVRIHCDDGSNAKFEGVEFIP